MTWLIVGFFVVAIGVGVVAYLAYFSPDSARWAQYRAFLQNPLLMERETLQPGQRCGDAPFAFPTTGVIFGLWDQSYRPGHRHQGIDIFPGTAPGVTPVYAAYEGYLTRLPDWRSSVITRIPSDPLNPARQIWVYYTHMADVEGNSFVSGQFSPGTEEVFVEAGTFLGYQGNYSGDAANPTGMHLHVSIVRDDGNGNFLNELDIRNTYDPSPYFNLPLNHRENSEGFPVCEGTMTREDWPLVPDGA
jgi:murein DD-endopeptidase MepM/ murein hydrolase activator NlpD